MQKNKSFLLCIFLLILALFLQGCSYHAKVRRGIYKKRDYPNKIVASVMVVGDKFYDKTIYLDNDHVYSFRLNDGLPVAVADALGTLFTEVEVNEYKYRKNYDYIVEIEYEGSVGFGSRLYRDESVLAPDYQFRHLLQTKLELTVRNPKTGYAIARYQDDSFVILPTWRTDTVLWFTDLFTFLSLGILYPVDLQVFGSKVRKRIEQGIVKSLSEEIMPDMYEDRINFIKDTDIEQTNIRVDGKFIPFMQSTVFIQNSTGTGSGFLISPDGYIITNRHVVGNDRDVAVVLYDERNLLDKPDPFLPVKENTLSNKVRFGKVLKSNKRRDLALIKIEGENFPYLELETDQEQYTTGKQVFALGAPENIEWTLSKGVISAARNFNGIYVIQTDTPINPGNSGGPLISLETGKVLGVNTWKKASQSPTENLNFAISSFEVERTLGVSQPVVADDFPSVQD